MKLQYFFCFVVLVFLSACWARDMIVGTSYNTRLTWQQKAEYNAIPFKKRVKEVFYSDPAQQTIKVSTKVSALFCICVNFKSILFVDNN